MLQCRLKRSYPNFDIWHGKSHNPSKTAVKISGSFLYFLAADGRTDTHTRTHTHIHRATFIIQKGHLCKLVVFGLLINVGWDIGT